MKISITNMKTHTLKLSGAILACVYFLASTDAQTPGTNTNAAPAIQTTPRLVVTKAIWGDPTDSSSMNDVTELVAGMVTNDTLVMDASVDNLGDPASGVTKELKVNFTFDGVPGTKCVYERGTIKISAADKPTPAQKGGTLVIRKAIYGNLPDGDKIDVTSIVAGMVRNNSLALTVNNGDFGDPAAYEKKELKVDYTLDGKDGTQTADEGKVLKIPSDGM